MEIDGLVKMEIKRNQMAARISMKQRLCAIRNEFFFNLILIRRDSQFAPHTN